MFSKIFWVYIFLLGSLTGFGQTTSKMKKDNKKEADRVWELAVEAKGGREKLYAVSNMIVSSSANKIKFDQVKSHTLNFTVFPDKEWEWDDNRPSVFGLRMTMYNWKTGMKYIVQSDGDPKEWGLEQIEPEKLKSLRNENGVVKWAGLALYILETKWWQPTPISLETGKINNQKVDIVQTILFGKRVDFFFDQNTHLPARIRFFNHLSTRRIIDANTIEISEYIDVSGIKMPTKIIENDGSIYSLNYKFNVDYNEEIFERPPLPVENAVDAWKKGWQLH